MRDIIGELGRQSVRGVRERTAEDRVPLLDVDTDVIIGAILNLSFS